MPTDDEYEVTIGTISMDIFHSFGNIVVNKIDIILKLCKSMFEKYLSNQFNERISLILTSKIYRIIYNSSIFIPFLLLISILKFTNRKVIIGSVIFMLFLIILYAQIMLLKWSEKHIMLKRIDVDSCDGTKDEWMLAYVIGWLSPLSEKISIIRNLNISNYILFIVGLLLIILTFFRSNRNYENLVFRLKGYKMYSITSNGMTYTIYSKRNIRNTRTIKRVYRIFEYILVEVD